MLTEPLTIWGRALTVVLLDAVISCRWESLLYIVYPNRTSVDAVSRSLDEAQLYVYMTRQSLP